MKKLKELFEKYYDQIAYLFFGALTTLVNLIVFWPCHNLLNLEPSISNAIAWVPAVSFAFLTNKPFVFHSHDWSVKVVFPEFVKFVGARIGSFAVEQAIIYLTGDILRWDGNLWKLVTSVLVVALNYVGSKLLVFKK